MNPLRHSLATLALAGLLLAGCSQADGPASLSPAEIDRSTTCSLDGMLLADYPGPKAQIHYADQKEPVFFCDTMELFSTLLAGEQARKVVAVYVQDMGQADWDEPQGHWVDAKAAFYVLGSDRHGSMGPTLASFAQEDAAKAFVAKHGGRLLRFAEVKPEMVDLSGGALHDSRM
ncbi:MAG: nitrous oxide reductase accessory protein NosL [Aquabacterium sp.]|nr:nitrous oxide reductase accessory protein NosL [Aquabacterium sp.]